MELSRLTKRCAAILALQKKQMQFQPGSYLFDVYDKACDLALNPERKIDEFLTRNLIRDAKITLKRKKNSVESSLEENKLREGVLDNLLSTKITPEHQLIYSNYIEQIKRGCRQLHRHAESVFLGMLAGDSSKDIAVTIHISESLVKKIRIEIKALVRAILLN